jgi:hypothetical protein
MALVANKHMHRPLPQKESDEIVISFDQLNVQVACVYIAHTRLPKKNAALLRVTGLLEQDRTIVAGDLNFLAEHIPNDYPITRMWQDELTGEVRHSAIDYIKSTTIPKLANFT